MRIATWNVNSLKARHGEGRVVARPGGAGRRCSSRRPSSPTATRRSMAFAMAGYDLVHHGEGRWNGVAVAVRQGIAIARRRHELRRRAGPRLAAPGSAAARRGGLRPARRGADAGGHAARRADPLRVVSLYAPNGRVVDSPFYARQARLVRPAPALARRGARSRASRSSSAATSTSRRPTTTSGTPRAAHGGTHVSDRRARRVPTRCSTGASCDAYRERPRRRRGASRGGTTAPETSTRTSGCGSTTCW